MDGDVLHPTFSFPDSNGYGDRKAIVIIHKVLSDDDSKELW